MFSHERSEVLVRHPRIGVGGGWTCSVMFQALAEIMDLEAAYTVYTAVRGCCQLWGARILALTVSTVLGHSSKKLKVSVWYQESSRASRAV